jgi:hypothetical protein
MQAVIYSVSFVYIGVFVNELIPVAELSKAWVFGRSLARIAVSSPAGCIDISLL